MLRNYCLARLLSCDSIEKWFISVSCSWLFIRQNEREASSHKKNFVEEARFQW